MEVKTLIKAVHEWELGKAKFVRAIKISPQSFHELASDKDAIKHLELFGDEHRIIGHKFNGIPLVITRDVDTIEIM